MEFGYEKSKQFMDAKRRRGKSDIRTLIDLHNNEAGRLVRNGVRMNTRLYQCRLFTFSMDRIKDELSRTLMHFIKIF